MEPSARIDPTGGCMAAFRSTRAAKNLFMILILVALACQLGAFCAVQWGGIIDELHRPSAAASQPQTQPSEAKAAGTATFWNELMLWGLPTTKFVAFVAALMVALTLMMAVKIAIVGRLGGVGQFTSAFYWSIVLLAFVTPWQQVLAASLATGALYNLKDLTDAVATVKATWGAPPPGAMALTLYYVRFIAYPVVALLVWLVVLLKFAGGHRRSALNPIGTVPDNRPSPI
jgi:hypothetical protein